MSKLILHLGPTRTGTTYIWRLLTENDMLFNKVKLNIPSEQIRLLNYARTRLQAGDPGLYQLEHGIKEDHTLIDLINAANSSHPSEKKLNIDRWNKLFYWWKLKLNNIRDSAYNQIGNKLNVITPFSTSNPLNCFPELEKELLEQFDNNTLIWGLPEDYENFINNPSPQLLMSLNLVLQDRSWANVQQGVGGFQRGNIGSSQFDVTRYNGTVTVDDLIEWIPARQQLLLDVIEQLSLHYDELVLCIALRDPVQRIQSWISFLKTRAEFNPSIKNIITGLDQHSCQTDNPDIMRNWINNIISTYLDYPVLSSLFTNKLPDTVTVRTILHSDLNTPEKLHNFLPEFFDADCGHLKGFNTPVLRSAFEKNTPLNKKLIDLNYEYYELIINNTASPTE